MTQSRPYQLQVQAGDEWEIWSNYVHYEKAEKRAAQLAEGGRETRVLDTRTSQFITAEECIIFCGEIHVGANTDGSCLL